MPRSKQRDWRFEALRLLSMFFIVATHFAYALFADPRRNTGIFAVAQGGWKQAAENALTMFGQTGVTIFVLISAWFLTLSHRSPKKRFISLWLQVVLYSAGIWIVVAIAAIFIPINEPVYTVHTVISSAFPLLFRQYWFMSAFAVMILAGPFINVLLDHLDQKATLSLTAGLFFVVFLWPLINPASYYFTDPLYLITIYFIGSYFRRYGDSLPRISGWTASAAALICYLLCAVGSRVVSINQVQKLGYVGNLFTSGPGASPFLGVISGAVIFLWVAQKTARPAPDNRWGRVINYLSPATLGIYLLHENWMLKPYWWKAVLSYPSVTSGVAEVGLAFIALILCYIVLTLVSLLITRLVVQPLTARVTGLIS